MLEDFNKYLCDNFPFLIDSKFIIAMSSGVDSVVLSHLCYKLNLNFSIAHCNFSLRGKESDLDSTFAKDLAKKFDVPYFYKKFKTEEYINESKLNFSIQMAARELRYNWFRELLFDTNFILTAHHLDDQLETFLINLSRGSGLSGLVGIPENNKRVLRPLLNFSKKEILKYAISNKIKWREDSSNENNNNYLRNNLRNNLIPIYKKIEPSLLSNFNKSIKLLKKYDSLVKEIVEDFLLNNSHKKDNYIKYSVESLIKLSQLDVYLYEIFNKYGFTNIFDIKNILSSQSGKQIISKTHVLLKDREYLILSPLVKVENKEIIIEKINQDIGDLIDFNFVSDFEITYDKSEIFIDYEKLIFPLKITNNKSGLYFYPFGMNGKKSVSKFLKDEKISSINKGKISFLLNGNGELIWVIGYRMDDRYKVDSKVCRVLKVNCNKL